MKHVGVRTRDRRHGETGETLVEILVSVTILGIAMVAIMAGIATALRLSGTQRRSANAAVVLGLAAEAVKGATPLACAGLPAAAYKPALDAIAPTIVLPVGWTDGPPNLTSTAVCDAASTLKLQTVTIVATACASTCPSETVAVIKRSP